ncbi:LysR family transcriptional regulator [Rhizobium sp. P38BS-XIX]|uniref:LysR family transcriptional regulator n=1 Tax=Rhizobium sp. P38BS-XIX TaxID=2726740 RepID=UPI0014570DB7|nr:LysR family transcriptional regulator [Rhizobium sp. P38BS-XIX]NLS00696.1 LysR family transcriptional regulator [Rhizobium sp. P38BS-XIX]
MNRIELDGIAIFLAVAELKGFRAAARELGITASAVSQSIRSLEQRLGAPLLSRTTRSVSLTEAGEQLLAHAKPAADLFQAGMDAARDLGEQPSGHLRINAPRPTVSLLIDALLPDFHFAYPKIRLELVGEDEFVDIVGQGFDAGIRLGHTVEVDMISTWLTPAQNYVVAGTPDMFDRHGMPTTPEELQRLPAILTRRNGQIARSWEFSKDGRGVRVDVDGPLIVNDYEAGIRAALRGVGLLYTIRSVIADHIERGSLVPVLEQYSRQVPGLSLYYPSRSQSLPKLRAFVEFATRRLRHQSSGEAPRRKHIG